MSRCWHPDRTGRHPVNAGFMINPPRGTVARSTRVGRVASSDSHEGTLVNITDSVALVSGANRGMGRVYVSELLNRGAARVYAVCRDPRTLDPAHSGDERVVPVSLDITDAHGVAMAAANASDVSLLINNAGSSFIEPVVSGELDRVRREFETHVFGTLNMVRAFAPVLAANGGGAILTMLSALSWVDYYGLGSYTAAKTALWGLNTAIRHELAAQRTQVVGLHVGATDTDMTAGYEIPKVAPEEVVAAALDGVAAGSLEVLFGTEAEEAKKALARTPEQLYPGSVPGTWS
ncbi:SDR family oxidoreductase [Amycolatopsis coloradensis]|uniref:SDR family oxidoreductase n=1 Tax=Amycolatopsis coloradensis TaxID=76021 RepID=UPI001FC9C609|nr:SDR family oxidoreductase [Amycolatopsis coloradensis]